MDFSPRGNLGPAGKQYSSLAWASPIKAPAIRFFYILYHYEPQWKQNNVFVFSNCLSYLNK
jgi:hypothetical protein